MTTLPIIREVLLLAEEVEVHDIVSTMTSCSVFISDCHKLSELFVVQLTLALDELKQQIKQQAMTNLL